MPARGTSGLLSLILLLLCAIACTAAFTGYLLRIAVTQLVATPRPAAYAVWYRDGAAVLAIGPTGTTSQVPLPLAGVGTVQSVSLAPDGRRTLLVADRDGVERAWLLATPSAPPLPLPLPPGGQGSIPWRYFGAAWTGPHSVVALLVADGQGGQQGLLARYTVAGTPPAAHATWLHPEIGGGRLASLSPAADQVALAEIRSGSGAFAPQVAVRLQHLDDINSTVALRYLGAQMPDAVLWSPDGGTLAVSVPGQGLAIQKSSGRAVRQVPDGALPADFSERGADLAYVSGSGTHWQIHVLNLHGEADHQFPAPGGARPQWLRWTPDAQALLCLTNGTLWQIEPVAGTPTRLRAAIAGEPLAIVSAVALVH
jgi:hypothetical protein